MDNTSHILVTNLDWVLLRIIREVAAFNRDELTTVLGALLRVEVREFKLDLEVIRCSESALELGLKNDFVVARVSTAILDGNSLLDLVVGDHI